MSRSPQPYLPLASHVSVTPFSLQFVCLSLHRSQDFPTFTICWLQVLSFVLWHRILERPPQMPSWRSTALNRPTFLLQLFLVNFQRSWNCFLVNAMSSKLKAFSILAKKSGKSILVGRPAGRCSQFLAISSLALFTAISSHFYAWCPILTTFFTPRISLVFSGHRPKKDAKLQIMGCDSIQQCIYIQICSWGENTVFQEIIFEQTSHIYCKYRKMYTIHCCYLSYFPSTSPGTATRPSLASVHGLMGQRGRKSKNESGLLHPPSPSLRPLHTSLSELLCK